MSYGRFISTVGALLVLGCSAASACDVGQIACENGYKYVCKCWTTGGCIMESAGNCHHDDLARPQAFNLTLKSIRQARLVCGGQNVVGETDSCSQH
jgi:hypothetical protein